MNLETIFSIASGLAALGWIGLALSHWLGPVRKVLFIGIVPLILAVMYSILIIMVFTSPGGSRGGFGSLAQVAVLFENPQALLAGWIHYLAFDLLIGTYEVYDARKLGMNHLLVIPCLFATFMFGPIGFLLYNFLKLVHQKRVFFLEDQS